MLYISSIFPSIQESLHVSQPWIPLDCLFRSVAPSDPSPSRPLSINTHQPPAVQVAKVEKRMRSEFNFVAKAAFDAEEDAFQKSYEANREVPSCLYRACDYIYILCLQNEQT